MTSVQEKVVDKIRKLMELAGSSNEHEAEAAARRASELMAKHQISEAEVAMASGEAKVVVERGRIDADDPNGDASRVEAWHKYLATGIGEVFGCKVWMYGRGRLQKFLALGSPDAIATTRYLYMTLVRQIGRLSRAAMRERGEVQNAWRRAYSEGMVRRVVERLHEGKRAGFEGASTTALVWVDKTKQAVMQAYEELSHSFRPNKTRGAQLRQDAHGVGYRDGEKVDVGGARAAIGEGQKKLR